MTSSTLSPRHTPWYLMSHQVNSETNFFYESSLSTNSLTRTDRHMDNVTSLGPERAKDHAQLLGLDMKMEIKRILLSSTIHVDVESTLF